MFSRYSPSLYDILGTVLYTGGIMNEIKKIRKTEIQGEAWSKGNSQKIHGLRGIHQQWEGTNGF